MIDTPTTDLREWLRAELAADRQAAAEKSLGEWLITGLDTVVALGLLARTMIHSVVYAVNHNEPDAEIGFSLVEPPLTADCWRFVDRLQAAVLGPIVVAWVIEAHEVAAMPGAWLGLLAANAAVLVGDPVVVVAQEVAG